MSTYVVLLRAVNVGGTGKLPMADLRRLAEDAGFTGARTYIASGNLVLESDDDADAVAVGRTLERALAAYAGKPVGVLVRTPAEVRRVLADNPFPGEPGNRVAVIFLPGPTPSDALDTVSRADDGEEVRVGDRVLYVHYPHGMGRSKLRMPAAAAGTARNLNTVAKLAELSAER
ncbi:protein of unknown function DUF1697 [Xylanimonas cellulosilytica DSM 15894]|uniref:DUF1697 domain-containing protein n=1 Tax=Xylanimonas cellulosilytica (strain DSM 15894 / JCM 12276 / CECT 5975 / KCTC 9989 / LMG 20990 / NBRC 107835 / XIL07) TaxID=446471 RepID=D1BU02_XYLCX|nr:DUF1697 domain-containing protein [Xylanimonas cellulosilytica]ACZ29166.1 protein of unknown function DUF1697 [Xylanimonas cellulosilytica DSM 15894]